MSGLKPIVAVSNEFLKAFAALPKAQQKKVRSFAERFQSDPTAASINYEPIHDMLDGKVRTVRIDDAYRAIVIHPPKGHLYLLVWVDHHDEAMAWARRKRFSAHPDTGALQVVDVTVVEGAAPPVAAVAATGSDRSLFAGFSDQDLSWTGLPAVLIPAVRALRHEADLDALQPHLPDEAYEGLVMLAAGWTVDDLLAEREMRVTAQGRFDPEDLDAALAQPDSRRRFVEISGPAALAEILSAPLEHWRIFLHPSQEKLVSKPFSGSARVLGGAGTGKTVVLMHRARHLARQVFHKPTERVLITTFTQAVAQSIEANLDNLCGDERSRIDVMTIDTWAHRFLRQQGMQVQPATDDDIQGAWDDAFAARDMGSFDERFYRSEWNQVVLAQGLDSRDDYLRASRAGRPVRLNRQQRDQVWGVFDEYREALARRHRQEFPALVRQATAILAQGHNVLPYRAVLVDEGQDFALAQYRLVRALVPEGPDDIFIVGDPFQRIYRRQVVLSQAQIHVRGRASTLRVNYRTTQQIRNWAVAVLDGRTTDDLDGGTTTLDGYRSERLGAEPEVHVFDSLNEETAFLQGHLSFLREHAEPAAICVVARTRAVLNRYVEAIHAMGLSTVRVGSSASAADAVWVGTLHAIKGLEFKHLLVVGASEGTIPLQFGDQPLDEDDLRLERSLVYVAATRARDSLLITAPGPMNPAMFR